MLNKTLHKTNCRQFVQVSLVLTLSLLVLSVSALSHPPSSMELDYAGEEGVLTIQISHRVGNPSNHYVEKITVYKNGSIVLEESYSEQDNSGGGEYEFELDAQNGDTFEVRADCNQFGNISQSTEVEGVPVSEPVLLRAELTTESITQGVEEMTPASASGLAIALLDQTDNELKFSVTYKGLSDRPTIAHFHRAQKGEEGPPVRTIFGQPEIEQAPGAAPEGVNGFVNGVWTQEGEQQLTDELVEAILSGEIYVNIHTELNPAGEIRGQLVKVE